MSVWSCALYGVEILVFLVFSSLADITVASVAEGIMLINVPRLAKATLGISKNNYKNLFIIISLKSLPNSRACCIYF